MSLTPAPLILTLKFNRSAFDVLDALRKQYFPLARNFIPAHITLFHALPGEQEPSIITCLQSLCADCPPLHLAFPKLRFLGRGVALDVDSHELMLLRKRLATAWDAWLSAQDRHGYRPHITIQNKVAPDEARDLYERLGRQWKPIEARGEALLLWRYLGGPWELKDEFPFGSSHDL